MNMLYFTLVKVKYSIFMCFTERGVGPPYVGSGLFPDNNNNATVVLPHDAIEVVDLTSLDSGSPLAGFAKQSLLKVRFDSQ